MPPNTINVAIQRYDPDRDMAPRFVAYQVPRQEGMVVVDVLQYLYEHEAPDLGFLWECRTRRCGTCAMRVGDHPVLSCSEPVCDEMRFSPLEGIPVVRDLIVDRQGLEKRLAPWATENGQGEPREARVLLEPGEIAHYRALSECIDCFICDSVCPALQENAKGGPQFSGPRRLIRLEAQVQRRSEPLPWLLYAAQGNPSLCTRCFACTEACPRELRPAEAIGSLTKRLYERGELDADRSSHIRSFVRSILRGAWLDEFRLLVDVYGAFGVLKYIPQALRMLRHGKLPQPHFGQAAQARDIQTILGRLKKDRS
jgi:succinate dehydrogenase/fumarate reductase iron-sulfur protein